MKSSLGPALMTLLACLGTAAPQEKAAATPGAHLLFKETSRDTEQGFEMVHYALKAEGLPNDQRYALYGRWIDGSSKEGGAGTSDRRGGNSCERRRRAVHSLDRTDVSRRVRHPCARLGGRKSESLRGDHPAPDPSRGKGRLSTRGPSLGPERPDLRHHRNRVRAGQETEDREHVGQRGPCTRREARARTGRFRKR